MDSFSQRLILLCYFAFCSKVILAQVSDSSAQKGLSIEIQGGVISRKAVPFWMRSNQYGSIPVEGGSGSILIQTFRNYTDSSKSPLENKKKLWDWSYRLEARANIGSRTQLMLIDAHAKMRFAMFEIKAGRSKDVMGLNGDTLLSTGNFAVSGNALGIPKIEISIPEYYRIPWFDGLFSVKGNFANGYMGKEPVNLEVFKEKPINNQVKTLLHQKSLYGRLGRASWKTQFFGGISHQAQWGGEKKVYGKNYDLSKIQTMWYVLWAIPYGEGETNIPKSKIGNHQGSIDLGFSYDFKDISIQAYRQSFYDVGAISKLANIKDGLNGITLTNKRFEKQNHSINWHKLLFEFFYSKDQAGYPWSKPTKSGDEDYYNNYFYSNGWSYKAKGIGTPLIISANSARAGQAHSPGDFFISNRVIAGHLGAKGKISMWSILTKLTYARHYGTFATSEYGKTTGEIIHPPHEEKFIPATQFSVFLKGERNLNMKTIIGGGFAIDQGTILPSSSGITLYLRRNF